MGFESRSRQTAERRKCWDRFILFFSNQTIPLEDNQTFSAPHPPSSRPALLSCCPSCLTSNVQNFPKENLVQRPLYSLLVPLLMAIKVLTLSHPGVTVTGSATASLPGQAMVRRPGARTPRKMVTLTAPLPWSLGGHVLKRLMSTRQGAVVRGESLLFWSCRLVVL